MKSKLFSGYGIQHEQVDFLHVQISVEGCVRCLTQSGSSSDPSEKNSGSGQEKQEPDLPKTRLNLNQFA